MENQLRYNALNSAAVPIPNRNALNDRELAIAGMSPRGLLMLLGLAASLYNGYSQGSRLYNGWGKTDEDLRQEEIERNRGKMMRSPIAFDAAAQELMGMNGKGDTIPPEYFQSIRDDNWNPERMHGFPGIQNPNQPYDPQRAISEYVRSGRYKFPWE